MWADDTTDLGWLAFCYVSDEMSDDEARAFEDRLSVDQEAREAVAQMVQLCHALSVAPAETVTPARPRDAWLQPVRWLALGIAACLALVVALREAPRPAAPGRVASDGTTEQLALAWAESSGGIPVNDEGLDQLAAGVDEVGVSMPDGEADQEMLVPGWLLEAVSGHAEAAESPTRREET